MNRFLVYAEMRTENLWRYTYMKGYDMFWIIYKITKERHTRELMMPYYSAGRIFIFCLLQDYMRYSYRVLHYLSSCHDFVHSRFFQCISILTAISIEFIFGTLPKNHWSIEGDALNNKLPVILKNQLNLWQLK